MAEGSPEQLDKKYNFTVRIQHEQDALNNATRICPLTIEEGEYMIEKYGVDPHKIRVTNNGVLIDEFYPPDPGIKISLRKKLGLTPDDLPVLLIARIDPRKGQSQLIEAAPGVIQTIKNRTGKNVKLLFVAWVNTEYAHSLETRIKQLNIQENVIFHPPVLNRDIAPYFWISAVYSLSSTYDIFPIVMLEAMASGIPIVATKNGGPSEVISHGEDGYLVETTNKKELADTLIKVLISEEEQKRMGNNAHKKVVEHYTWGKIAIKTMEIYREMFEHK